MFKYFAFSSAALFYELAPEIVDFGKVALGI